MTDKPVQEEKRVFMTGNEVVAWAAVAAGADIMYGYPITPQNEVMHYWTRLAPKFDKKFLQTEDELSAGFATIGGALAGRKSFSATAGPGTTLFQEPVSMAEMMRIPMVVVVQQRGGPSTATVIYSQQEVNMVTFGGNGEGWRVVYSTATHQEVYDYTIKSFNVAWKYRFPVFLLGDGYQAKMREPVTMYNPEDRGIELVEAEATLGQEGVPGKDRPARHIRNAYSVEEELYEASMPIQEEWEKMAEEITEWEEENIEDADVVIISHGVVSRAAIAAMNRLREKGVKVGYFRPITLRPFPNQQLREVAKKCSNFLLVESALGQLARLVKDALFNIPVENFDTIYKPGVGITAEELVEHIQKTR
ncbi:transketolase C-terminal domain-containing protein [Dethiobacter alkaliphilus]|uniref:Pyruvate flavodoxin/ferredoxin oxidoreductase domain protein n=1 Tax=Dethiobacter alkaliphilus AHT 1 TaxID=555088 RepID=C0GJ92_DETAL|nr:transketolase C-terminal domain-containing protein [Dethiobacter alkaliphilus]EEG76577.1 pyruvate flavodoxin/ferredoxin oxidoreductase domain protein [Dethiobacter alkaliphilus AHT 1]